MLFALDAILCSIQLTMWGYEKPNGFSHVELAGWPDKTLFLLDMQLIYAGYLKYI